MSTIHSKWDVEGCAGEWYVTFEGIRFSTPSFKLKKDAMTQAEANATNEARAVLKGFKPYTLADFGLSRPKDVTP